MAKPFRRKLKKYPAGGRSSAGGLPRQAAVIWTPQPRQRAFMARREWEALYGGAAGGGKSEALVMEALRQVHIPHYKALILRKTFPELRELIDKTQRYYPRAFPKAGYHSGTHTWTFPSGARVVFGAMQHPRDRTKYQGQAYDFIAFDELTHFTWEEYSYLFSRCRPNGPGTRCYIRSTANPGGIGHGWVKERFITAAPPMTPIREEVSWRDAGGALRQAVRSRVFVPASVFDNAALLQNDPGYAASLASLPEAERNALLYGDWDSFSGQVFTEWRNDPEHYADGLGTHVIDPFPVPADWAIWCSLDWGYTRPFSVGWYAVDHDRRLYRIREYYGVRASEDGTPCPDQGARLDPSAAAEQIRRIEADDPNLRGKTVHRVGDPAIWGSQTGESVGDMLARRGLYFERGEHSRRDGKMQVHYRLRFDGEGRPGLYVFKGCRNLIRTLPALVYDASDPEDVDTRGEDHAYDELRYVCMKNPIAPARSAPPAPQGWSPLE
ncbi:MAG: terminase family protein [Oscillospiraceae bacterium]|nr:terminase family protein [Oscillospiraceae bacterium]